MPASASCAQWCTDMPISRGQQLILIGANLWPLTPWPQLMGLPCFSRGASRHPRTLATSPSLWVCILLNSQAGSPWAGQAWPSLGEWLPLPLTGDDFYCWCVFPLLGGVSRWHSGVSWRTRFPQDTPFRLPAQLNLTANYSHYWLQTQSYDN